MLRNKSLAWERKCCATILLRKNEWSTSLCWPLFCCRECVRSTECRNIARNYFTDLQRSQMYLVRLQSEKVVSSSCYTFLFYRTCAYGVFHFVLIWIRSAVYGETESPNRFIRIRADHRLRGAIIRYLLRGCDYVNWFFIRLYGDLMMMMTSLQDMKSRQLHDSFYYLGSSVVASVWSDTDIRRIELARWCIKAVMCGVLQLLSTRSI